MVETVQIQNNKTGQAINIPKEMEISDDKVYLKKVGNTIHIIPFNNPWQNLVESLDNFTADFMDSREQPTDQNRESFD